MQNKQDFINLKVDAFTTPSPIMVVSEESISKIIKIMDDNGVRHLPVTNGEGVAVGIITDRDVATVKAFAFNKDIKAADLMSSEPLCVTEGTTLVDATYLMSERKIGSVIVNDRNGKVVGIFTSTDALNALIEVLRGEVLEEE